MRAGSFLFLLLWAASLGGVEIHIDHAAIERGLVEQLFSDEGRMYLRGSRGAKCSYAYLEDPEVTSEAGRLKIRAQFTGRSATDLFGACIGPGGSFVVLVTAAPYYQDGVIKLRDVTVESQDGDGFYFRRARAALAEELPKKFSYAALEYARRVIEQPGEASSYQKSLKEFRVSEIRVTDDALILVLEFVLAVK